MFHLETVNYILCGITKINRFNTKNKTGFVVYAKQRTTFILEVPILDSHNHFVVSTCKYKRKRILRIRNNNISCQVLSQTFCVK